MKKYLIKIIVIFIAKYLNFLIFNQYFYISRIPDSVDKKKFKQICLLRKKFNESSIFNNALDTNRLLSLVFNIEQVLLVDKVVGDFAEVGVYKGATATVFAHYAKTMNRKLYLFDTFEGFDDKESYLSEGRIYKDTFKDTSIKVVESQIGLMHMPYVKIIKGNFPSSVKFNDEIKNTKFAIVHLDCDLYDPIINSLNFFENKMQKKGLIIIHDYNNPNFFGAKKAVDEFINKLSLTLVSLNDKSGTCLIKF